MEWQVCGICNYDCSYCIQSKKYRVGHPSPDEVEKFLDFFQYKLPGSWEIKMTGGEPFAFKDYLGRIIPGLIADTPHRLSTLTNLSAPPRSLQRFAELTMGRLEIVSASLHLESTTLDEFLERATLLRRCMDPAARLVINTVLAPEQLAVMSEVKRRVEAAGLKLFPQWMKVKNGRHDYTPQETAQIIELTSHNPTPKEANLSPSYKGHLCWTGVEYLVLMQNGDAWSCRTAKRHGDGFLGNVLNGDLHLRTAPLPCAYDICPCTVPANRGMIEGLRVS